MAYTDLETVFTFERQLGQGAFGTVWKVKDRASGEVRALKLIEYSGVNYDLINEELRALRGIALSPSCKLGLACYYDIDYVKFRGKVYIGVLMSYHEGLDLFQYFRVHRPSRDVIYHIMHALFSGLQELHSRKVYHRDIKPENIIVQDPDHIFLIDFGLSCYKSDCGVMNQKLGTPMYFPPESETNAYRYNPEKYDIFEMGISIIQSLLGLNPPAKVGDPYGYADQRMLINKFRENKRYFDPTIYSVLTECVETDPNRRPTAYDILLRLKISYGTRR